VAGLTLAKAKRIIAAALKAGREQGFKPLGVVVLDAGGHVKAFEREDGASNLRFEIARGKANGALAMGLGSRALMARAERQPYFVEALNGAAGGMLIPVPGGVLIKSARGEIIGAVGVTGDISDNDELCAVRGIEAAGFVADPG
jgi:uncharacterized protein GlcG (DUF336 family)